MDWIGLAQDTDRWRTLVSAVMNLRVPWNAGNFLTSCKPVSFSRRTLHHWVSKYVFFVCRVRILLSHHYQSPRTSLCHRIAECQTSTLCLFDLWSRRRCHLLHHSPSAIVSTLALQMWVASASCVLFEGSSVLLAWHTVHPPGLTYILCNLKYWQTPGPYSIKCSVNSTYALKLRLFTKRRLEKIWDFLSLSFIRIRYSCMYAGFV